MKPQNESLTVKPFQMRGGRGRVEGAGGEGKERGKGGRDFTDTGTFGGG